jgi:hypothetical protein
VYEAELSTNNLRLHGNDPTVISGDITLTRARYVKDVIEGADLLQVTESVPTAEAPPPDILRNLQLDLNLTTQEPLEIENNIASGVEADAAVRITGRYDDPDLQGRIDFERGGEVDIPFLRGTFEIDRGRVNLDREVGDARVDVVAQRRESTFSESRGIQLRLFGTLSAIRWSCSHPGDTSGNLDTVRGCTEYLVLGRGEGQISDPDVQRFGQGGLSNAHKPLQVAGNITEIDLGERLSDAAPRFRTYIPELRIRAGEIGPEIESRTPVQWFDFYYGHATLGATYTRGYPGFLLRQSSDVNVQLHILDPITLEYSLRNRSYLNDRVIFDPREQQTLELRFDLRFPSLR